MPRSLKRLTVGLTSVAAIAAAFALASSPPGLSSASGPSATTSTTEARERLTVKIYDEPVGVGDDPAATGETTATGETAAAGGTSAGGLDDAASWSGHTSAYGTKVHRDC